MFNLKPKNAALLGFLIIFPVAIVFLAIVFELRPIEIAAKSILTSNGSDLNLFGKGVLLLSMLGLPICILLNIRLMFRKDLDGKRHFHFINFLIALLAIIIMVPTWGSLAEEIYRCDILEIPNCD